MTEIYKLIPRKTVKFFILNLVEFQDGLVVSYQK